MDQLLGDMNLLDADAGVWALVEKPSAFAKRPAAAMNDDDEEEEPKHQQQESTPPLTKKPAGPSLLCKRPAGNNLGKDAGTIMNKPAKATGEECDDDPLRQRVKSRKFHDMWEEIPSNIRECYEEAFEHK